VKIETIIRPGGHRLLGVNVRWEREEWPTGFTLDARTGSRRLNGRGATPAALTSVEIGTSSVLTLRLVRFRKDGQPYRSAGYADYAATEVFLPVDEERCNNYEVEVRALVPPVVFEIHERLAKIHDLFVARWDAATSEVSTAFASAFEDLSVGAS
jgi:hypothetical protein